MKYFATTLALGFFLFNSFASAETIYAPDWRGDEGTTYQAWTFDDASSPAVLDPASNNTYGVPTATIFNPMDMTDWLPSYNAGGSEVADGVWMLYAGKLLLEIPNTDNTSPESWKEIWLQITYYDPAGAGGDLPIVVFPVYESLERLSRETLDTNFYRDTYEIIIRPNPLEETIKISPIQCQLYVDAISIDTICVPEPSILTLLAAVMGLAILKRRGANELLCPRRGIS